MEPKLKYRGYSITFQEVPDEVSLVINISGCPYKCKGCHSDYLWEYEGPYLLDDLKDLLDKYKKLITCVCFMGGDQNIQELTNACNIVKENGLKVCLYSGRKFSSKAKDLMEQMHPNYYKIGNYDDTLGGLDNPRTNQRFYKLVENNYYTDITSVFWNRRDA